MTRSLATRAVVLPVAVLAAAGLVLMAAGSLWQSHRLARRAAELEAQSLARETARALQGPLLNLDLARARAILAALRERPDVRRAVAAGPDGTVLSDGTENPQGRYRPLESPFEGPLTEIAGWRSLRRGGAWITAGPVRLPGGEVVGFLLLETVPVSAGSAAPLLAVSALFFLAAAAVVAFAWRQAARPLAALEALAEKLPEAKGGGLEAIAGAIARRLEQPAGQPAPAPPSTGPEAWVVVPAFLTDALPLAFLQLDGRIKKANPPFGRLVGKDPAELPGTALADLLPEGAAVRALLQDAVQRGAAEGMLDLAADGTRPALLSLLAGRDPEGTVREVVCLAREQPREREGPEAERLREELEQARRERVELARQADQQAAEITQLRKALEQARQEQTQLQSNRQLWEWAEDELKRVKALLQRTQEKLARAEERLADVTRDRDWANDRLAAAEEELLALREQLASRDTAAATTRAAATVRQTRASLGPRDGEAARPAGPAGVRPAPPAPPAPEEAWPAPEAPAPSAAPPPAPAQPPPQEPPERPPPPEAEPPSPPTPEQPSPPSARRTLPVVDWAEALAGVDGDVEFLKAIVAVFLDDCPRLLGEVRAAAVRRDATDLERAARMLKGAVGNFGAKAAMQAALRLENLARDRNLDGVEEAYRELEAEIEALRPALSELRETGVPPQ